MANSVTKDEVKAFVRSVRIEMDRRNAAKFAPAASFNSVKGELDSLQNEVNNINLDNFVEQIPGKGLSTNDFTDDDKKLLAQLAKETNSAFDAADVLDIFDD